MAGLALLGEENLQDVVTKNTYAGTSTGGIRGNLQDGECPYSRRRCAFHQKAMSDEDMNGDDMENMQEPSSVSEETVGDGSSKECTSPCQIPFQKCDKVCVDALEHTSARQGDRFTFAGS